MVEAAGQEWPDGWVKGEGFVRPRSTDDPMKPPPTVTEIGEEYVRQVVDLSPGQRKRYLAQVRLIASVEVSGRAGPYRPFDRSVAMVKEGDVKAWLIGWDRSWKTKANYHGLLFCVFSYRRGARLDHRQPVCSHGSEAQPDQAVSGGPALPHRA